MKRRCALFIVSACSLAATSVSLSVWAADAGDPIFPLDLGNKARAEIIYENQQRDLDITSGPALMDAKLDADVYLLRMHTDVGQFAYLDFDVGWFDPTGGDGSFYGGIGLRYLAYDSPGWRVSPFAQVHYVPNVESDSRGAKLEYDLIEADGGVLLACKIKIDDQLTLMPYAGPVLSILRLDGDVESAGTSDSFDAEEDSVLGIAAGLALELPGQNSIRIEGRYFDDISVSAAAGIAF